eukprot:14494720-Heterocapsa_arctica.AAC.1
MASVSSASQGSAAAVSFRISATAGQAADTLRITLPRSLLLRYYASRVPLSKGAACAMSRSEGWRR